MATRWLTAGRPSATIRFGVFVQAEFATNGKTMRTLRPLSIGAKTFLAGLTLLLPTLSLVPLGGLYLWEHGYLLWWAIGALVIVSLTMLALKALLTAPERKPPVAATNTLEQGLEAHWNEDEAEAWHAVQALAAGVNLDALNDVEYVALLGQLTLNTVAQRLHPEKTDALWRFTLPEALAIIERVSRRLGAFVQTTIPFGDRLTVAQFLAMYRWRSMVDVAERAYDVWRLVRLANPATAVTHEARERLSRAVYNFGKEQVSRRIAEAYVEEVGRAAIDLYSGRLQVANTVATDNAAAAGAATTHDAVMRPVALKISIAGGARIERVALASELSKRLTVPGASAEAEDSVTFGMIWPAVADIDDAAAAARELKDADIIVWIVSADDDESEKDRGVVRRLKSEIGVARGLLSPMLVAVRLQGFAGNGDGISLDESARALSGILGSPPIAPLVIGDIDFLEEGALSALIATLRGLRGPARRIHLVRRIETLKQARSWTSSGRQAIAAAGSLTRAILKKRRKTTS
jgi:hypothetical protein